MMTPEMARNLLKYNKVNRRLRAYHVRRLAALMMGGRWRFNGDTIRLDKNGDLMDGQHRLNAIIDTSMTIAVVMITGVERSAMSTIDTARLQRSFGDVLSLKGGSDRYQQLVGNAISWLCRYDRGVLPQMSLPENRIEADEIEVKFANCPKVQDAVERCMIAKNIVSPSMLGCVYYILTRVNQFELADRMVDTLVDPSKVPLQDPFYLLRQWFIHQSKGSKRRHPTETFAYMFKAINYAYHGHQPKVLLYKADGLRAEQFPVLECDKS